MFEHNAVDIISFICMQLECLGEINFYCNKIVYHSLHTKNHQEFGITFRYIDDVLSLNNSRLGDFVDRIYPIELEIKDTTDTDRFASYLDLQLEIDRVGRLRTKLYDKRDDFNQDFLDRGLQLTWKLLNQGYLLVKVKSSLRNVYYWLTATEHLCHK